MLRGASRGALLIFVWYAGIHKTAYQATYLSATRTQLRGSIQAIFRLIKKRHALGFLVLVLFCCVLNKMLALLIRASFWPPSMVYILVIITHIHYKLHLFMIWTSVDSFRHSNSQSSMLTAIPLTKIICFSGLTLVHQNLTQWEKTCLMEMVIFYI